MRFVRFSTLCLACAVSATGSAFANEECSRGHFNGPWPEHTISNLSVSEAQATFSGSVHFDGFEVALSEVGRSVELDAIAIPGTASAIASVRAIFILTRTIDTDAETFVLTNNRQPIYSFEMDEMKAIGCRFVWGVDVRSENPIALMRELADAARIADTTQRGAPRFNGSLLGDTNLALNFINEGIYPNWLLPDIEFLP